MARWAWDWRGQREPVLAAPGRASSPAASRCPPLNGLVFEEEAAAVEVQGDGRRQVVLVLVAVLQDRTVLLVHPVVQRIERSQDRAHIHLRNPKVAQAAEAGD